MNKPSRNDDVDAHPHWNQSPHALSGDLTTRADLNGIVNRREMRSSVSDPDADQDFNDRISQPQVPRPPNSSSNRSKEHAHVGTELRDLARPHYPALAMDGSESNLSVPEPRKGFFARIAHVLVRYAHFVGPGFMIAVAYIDPGNYATDVEAGAETRYAHLFIVLMSNLFAIFLQSLCIKLGSVTGLNLAENCRKHLPKWLNIVLYLMAESAIIATDIAEVIGSAIALNLLFHIPLVAGCAITVVDVLLLLIFYKPDGSMKRLRVFEFFVMGLVLGVMVCFCIQLSYIRDTSASEVFRGYLPSPAIIKGNGIYLSCGILGATVMPHSIFLGSGVVQPRLKQFDEQNGYHVHNTTEQVEEEKYRPSIHAIRSCLKYSIAELATQLFTFALFVNSAILIVAGSSLYANGDASQADLFGIHKLLSNNLSKAAGTIFALALLLSGTSAGIVATMAGQMVSEGMLNWTVQPWMRRLITRAISIIPSIVIAASVGRHGLSRALTASQVVLSVILPFVSAPLLWFTCKSSIMSVRADANGRRGSQGVTVNMRNGWAVTIMAGLIWLVLVVMNLALLVLVGLGKA